MTLSSGLPEKRTGGNISIMKEHFIKSLLPALVLLLMLPQFATAQSPGESGAKNLLETSRVSVEKVKNTAFLSTEALSAAEKAIVRLDLAEKHYNLQNYEISAGYAQEATSLAEFSLKTEATFRRRLWIYGSVAGVLLLFGLAFAVFAIMEKRKPRPA